MIETCSDIPDCMTAEEIWLVTMNDEDIDVLSSCLLHGWPSTKADIYKEVIETCSDIPDCMTAEEIWLVTMNDEDIDVLSSCVLHGWPSTKADIYKEVQSHWSLRKLDQMHMGTEKMRLLAY